MVDTRFFSNAGPFRLSDIASLTGAVMEAHGSTDKDFTDVAPLDSASASHISFLDNTLYLAAFTASKAGACFVRRKFVERAPQGMTLLVTEEPYTAYALTAQKFYPDVILAPGISPHAFISPSAVIGTGCRIDPGAVIGERVTIGADCWIGAGTVIGDGVEIGTGGRIGANSTISHAIIGKRVVIHRGVHIGQDGFGFAPSATGIVKVPQLGRVIIGDEVDIGSSTCIDRGAGPDTVIGSYSKIDNLVQIGHNVQIGKYVIITGQCGIAGSTRLDDGVMLGAQSGIAGHLHIGKGAKLAARAGVMQDVPPGETRGGTPAIPLRQWHRQTLALAQLSKTKNKE